MTICLLRIMPCRSFAVAARFVRRCCSDCPHGVRFASAAWLPLFIGRPFFFIKAFQRIRCPRLPFLLISSSRSSLRHPISSACCLRPALRLASRLASRPVLSLLMSSPSCPIAHRAVRLAVINRPALLVGWRGAGRDGTAYFLSSPARFAAAACLLWRGSVCVYSSCGGLLAYSVGGSICVGNVLAKLYI